MIKTILLSTFLVAFAVITIPMTSANACATCGCADKAPHTHVKKPCVQSVESGKPCECDKAANEPCEKTLGQKAPCPKCPKAKAESTIETSMETMPANNKGSLVIKAGQSFKSRAALYN